MIIITGNTYPHKEALKAGGATWDKEAKHWRLNPVYGVEHLRKLPGIFFHETAEAPRPEEHVALSEPSAPLHGIEPDHIEGDTRFYGDDTSNLDLFSGTPVTYFGFSDLSKMLDFVDNIDHSHFTAHGQGDRHAPWNTDASDVTFTKTPNMDAALRLGREGWSEGVTKAAEILDMLDAEQPMRLKRQNAMVGGAVSVGRMLAGNPIHMRRRAKQPGRKIIRLAVATSTSFSVDGDDMIIRAACVAAIVDLLELNNYSCEIIGYSTSSRRKDHVCNVVQLKHAGEALNLNDLVFALGHPSFLRRIILAQKACDVTLERFWHSGFGKPAPDYMDDPNTILIRNLPQKGKFDGDPHKILAAIMPDNLPVTLTSNPDD